MAWEWDEIERDWLDGGRVAAEPSDVVAAFERVERVFGRDWIEQSRMGPSGSPTTGSMPVVRLTSMGEWLASLEGIADSGGLLARLRDEDRSAITEAIAIHLFRSGDLSVEVELEPVVRVGDRDRKPDFRVRKDGSQWVYVEVTAAETSEQGKEVRDALFRLKQVMDEAPAKTFALEFFLRRLPTHTEERHLIERGLAVCGQEGPYEEELPDGLGRLRLNLTRPGEFTINLPEGEEYAPRTSAMHRELGPDVDRHVVARIAFTDDRAEAFLRAEARQLPNDAPGLVMIFPTGTGWDSWEATLRRRLQPDQHTRISAVCLVGSSLSDEGHGEEWRAQTRLIVNEHAATELPAWAGEKLLRFPDMA